MKITTIISSLDGILEVLIYIYLKKMKDFSDACALLKAGSCVYSKYFKIIELLHS